MKYTLYQEYRTIKLLSAYDNEIDAYNQIRLFWESNYFYIPYIRKLEIPKLEKKKIFGETNNKITKIDIGFKTIFYYIEEMEEIANEKDKTEN